MKKLIQFFSVFLLVLVPVLVQAQDPDTVSIRELNTYDNLTEYSVANIQAHPLAGETVVYTGVIVSNPRSSGLATPSDNAGNDGIIDDISRIHVFITDTAAVNQGRDGMSIQIVESDWELLGDLNRGDVVTFKGRLTFFNATAQMAVDEVVGFLGNVNLNFPQYAELLDPWEVPVDSLNIANGDGTYQVDISNYSKYNAAYVKITGGSVSNVSTGDRPNWAINENGSRIYVYDTSLRVRNDRSAGYLPSFNYRRIPGLDGGEDGLFVPPVPGAIVNVSGFLTMNGDDPDGTIAADQNVFGINPFEDGILWTVDDNTGDPLRCVSGELCNGDVLDWPNDIEIVGLPPVFSNVAQSDSSVTSSDAVTVTVDIVANGSATISGAELIYTDGTVTDTLTMTNTAGSTYSADLPTFPNFTPVAFYIEATDSEGLKGRAPISGNFGFFVQDTAIDAISVIQKTADELAGPSPLAGAGEVPVNISGLIVADAETDGVIVFQEAAEAWSGVFLELTSETEALVRGDSITITSLEVAEAEVRSNSLTLTQLINLEFTVNSSGNDIEAVIPVITTDTVQVLQNGGELENYEGMVVKFEGVELTSRGNFGEYVFKNTDADSSGGAIFNEDIRSESEIGSVLVEFDFNHTVREDKTMDAYAVVAASFGAPKFHPRNASDLVADDGNAFTPVLDFALTSPSDSAEIEVTGDLEVTWGVSEDFDGDDVTYEWVLYSADTANVIVTVPSNSSSSDNSVTLSGSVVDGLLADAGLSVGQSANFVWNVRVSDGSDTLGVRGSYGNFGDDWEPVYRYITLTRGLITSNDDEGSSQPKTFSLEQNYPNPFNPTTSIKFGLPNAANVTLTIYNMIGQKVATIVNGNMQAGFHTVQFDARNLASGMYLYRIEAGTFNSVKKMMLIK